jgi:hypothetical protein
LGKKKRCRTDSIKQGRIRSLNQVIKIYQNAAWNQDNNHMMYQRMMYQQRHEGRNQEK